MLSLVCNRVSKTQEDGIPRLESSSSSRNAEIARHAQSERLVRRVHDSSVCCSDIPSGCFCTRSHDPGGYIEIESLRMVMAASSETSLLFTGAVQRLLSTVCFCQDI